MVQSTAIANILVRSRESASSIKGGENVAVHSNREASPNNHQLSVIRTQEPFLVEQAQRLRYQTFFGNQANSWPMGHAKAIDKDEFDQHCEHLLVLDHNVLFNGQPKVVGTYRLRLVNLTQCRQENLKLYTATEFDLAKLMQQDGNVLELGRSCVHPDYRHGDVIRNLWSGIGEFLANHQVDYMIGCVSFFKADITKHSKALAYLNQYHLTMPELCPEALPAVSVATNDTDKIDKQEGKQLFRQLPPLIKAYIRMGATFSKGAVLDHNCDTLDLCVIAECKNIDPRYSKRFIK